MRNRAEFAARLRRALGARTPSVRRASVWVLGAAAFAVLATANAGGYRSGTSDQAFYIPATIRALDPHAFPRDSVLIDVQARLMVIDELTAWVTRATGLSIPAVNLLGYLLSLLLIWVALGLIGARVAGNGWATLALVAAFTLRYRVPLTSANSFEPYFHPRMLAFGLGAIAIAALLRQRLLAVCASIAASLLIHVTTGLWFALLIGVAIAYAHVRSRAVTLLASAAIAAVGAWMIIAGPLRQRLTAMDETWLQAVSGKDSLFPSTWPVWAWAANLAFLGLLWWAHRWRVRRADASLEDAGLVWGATALVAIFIVTLPLVTAGIALFVQLQISRVFWVVAFLATIYAIAAIAPAGPRRRSATPLAMTVAGLLVTLSVARAVYVMQFEPPARPLFAVDEPRSPWQDAMDWLKRQPIATHVLADPGHAWKYGTSVRVAAERDVLLEEVKDSAMAIYSREIGHRVVDRIRALDGFSTLDARRARELAARYDLDYLVIETVLPLPVAYRNSQFTIYAIGESSSTPSRARR